MRKIWTRIVWDRAPDGSLVIDERKSEFYWHDGPVAEAHAAANSTQDHYRFYETGTESGSTAIAAEDTDITRQTGVGNAFQLRLLVQENNGTTDNWTLKLKVSKNAGAYNDVTAASSNVRAIGSALLTDDEVTTGRLVGGAGPFTAGRVDDVDGALTTSVGIKSEHTEVLFNIYIVDADVADLDTLDFRAYATDDTALDGYNATARATVDQPVVDTSDIEFAATVVSAERRLFRDEIVSY